MAIAEALPLLEKIPLKIFHQTGEREHEVVKAMYGLHKQHAVVEPYFENMHEIMNRADLAVARAGASTCAELNLSGLPAILVPYPGAGGHQKLNAEALVAQGAAMMIDDAGLSGETLAETVEELFTDREKLEMMSANSREMARPDAGRTIAREIAAALEG
jgi:UDP-N-acetylglucosamine--N-acetylmuramyl-(pentapeptide) pyrophosphoryl-undecaprenol N-acetylglucosamine transferase